MQPIVQVGTQFSKVYYLNISTKSTPDNKNKQNRRYLNDFFYSFFAL